MVCTNGTPLNLHCSNRNIFVALALYQTARGAKLTGSNNMVYNTIANIRGGGHGFRR